jgi:hypothetical protein
MSNKKSRCFLLSVCSAACLITLAPLGMLSSPGWAASSLPIYVDSLTGGFEDWSWGGIDKNLGNDKPVHGGAHSIAVKYTDGWSGLQFGRNDILEVSGYDTFRFWVHGGTVGGQQIEVSVGSSNASVKQVVRPKASTWTKVDVPLHDLGKPTGINLIYWFNSTPGPQPVFYLDDISFVLKGAPPPPPVAGPALRVNVVAGRHPISPYIYGMNFAAESLAAELRLPVRRWGGNATTRYNWKNDTSNRAGDWFFENIPYDNDPSQLPDGSEADRFVEQDRQTSTRTLLTVPLIGWTPRSRSVACGYSVQKYGAQQEVDPWNPDCGNGISTDGSVIDSNDPKDTSIAITPAFVKDWLAHLIGKYGTAADSGVRFYNLDNEPMLWSSTHRDVHPLPTSYDEIRKRTYAYAAAIKAMDPDAQTCGPAVWGWTAYFWSALDWEPGGDWWNHPQDRLAHGDIPFVDWYLQQMRAFERKNGTRILDYLDVHFYPQGDGVFSEGAGNSDVQALRLRSTRALWDRTYTDESWIATPVYLIPRMRQWVARNYPDTKLAVSEYSWGAMGAMNGALAQADVLGIFGREGLDLATLWGAPTSDQPGAFAFRMYLNYNGLGAAFGDMSVRAASTDQDRLSIYAAQRQGDSALTLIIINKTSRALKSRVKLSGFLPGAAARVYRYGMDNLVQIVRGPDQAVGPDGFAATFPASSITLIEIPVGSS